VNSSSRRAASARADQRGVVVAGDRVQQVLATSQGLFGFDFRVKP
jgi:hypothetical protein